LKDGDEVLKYKTDPLILDTDSDGLNDGDEVLKYKTNPLVVDTDKDKLTDGDEALKIFTDPLNPDTDEDKVIDGEDDCPLIAGEKSNVKGKNGCPQPPKVGTKTDFNDILFIVNTDKFNFDMPNTSMSLAKMLAYVKQCDNLRVLIEGHASAEGDAKNNQILSEKPGSLFLRQGRGSGLCGWRQVGARRDRPPALGLQADSPVWLPPR